MTRFGYVMVTYVSVMSAAAASFVPTPMKPVTLVMVAVGPRHIGLDPMDTVVEATPHRHLGDGLIRKFRLALRQTKEQATRRALHGAARLTPHQVLRNLGLGSQEQMVDVDVVPEATSVDHPNQIAIEVFARLPLSVGHCRMLDLDDDPDRRLDIRAVDLTVGCEVRNLSAGLWEEIFPRPMPLGFIFPPRVAVAPASVNPVVQDARPALGDHRRAAGRAGPPPRSCAAR